MGSFASIPFANNNNQYITLGPIVDGQQYAKNPPVITAVTDLTITAKLYVGRSLIDPVTTPGTVVSAFGSGGSLVIPHIGNGVYQTLVAPFSVSPSLVYVMTFDAPVSVSGYQLHRERAIQMVTGLAVGISVGQADFP